MTADAASLVLIIVMDLLLYDVFTVLVMGIAQVGDRCVSGC